MAEDYSGFIRCFQQSGWRLSMGTTFLRAGILLSIRKNKGGRMPMKRTTHRSSKGTKLYAVRDSKGRFVDIQTYKRAHAADMRRKSKAELAKKP
jgi:hypothetical protein